VGYADADGASQEHRRAISGHVFLIDGGAISWSSKKQELVTLSTTEVEYVAATHAAKEAMWLRRLITELYGPLENPTTLFGDNQSAITHKRRPVSCSYKAHRHLLPLHLVHRRGWLYQTHLLPFQQTRAASFISTCCRPATTSKIKTMDSTGVAILDGDVYCRQDKACWRVDWSISVWEKYGHL
jgi:hypothetical protein